LSKEELKNNDVALLLATLSYNDKPIRGRTRFQKMIFLLKEKYKVPFSFKFKPYYYGPYSDDFADILSLLKALNLTEEKAEYVGVGATRYNYQLTDKGQKYVCRFIESAEGHEQEILRNLENDIREINQLQTPELISKAKALMANSGK
jgi:uncharacterized protein YwgA